MNEQEASATVNDTPPIGVDALDADQDIWQWFYQENLIFNRKNLRNFLFEIHQKIN